MTISVQTPYIFTLLLYMLLLLCVAPFGMPAALAAGHTVMPLALNLNVEKRDIISETITIANKTEQQVRLYPSVHEVATDGEGTVLSFSEPSSVDRTDTPTAWIEISRARIELAPGETKEIPFTIRMNPNTKPGDYSVFIGFGTGSNQPEATRQVMNGQAPGTLVNLTIDKKQDQFLRLERFVVDRFVTGRGESLVEYTLHNPSGVDVVHHGEVIFYDTNGDEIASVPLNEVATPVPPDASVPFSVVVPNNLKIGKYKAYLSVEFGEHLTDAVQDTTYFYVTPLRELIIAFVILLVLAVLLTLYVHRRYDLSEDDHGAEPVALYIRQGTTAEVHHDISVPRKAPPTDHA